jgi:hypothetical protein
MNLLDFDDSESAPAAPVVTDKALPALAPLAPNENGVSLALLVSDVNNAHEHVSWW